MKQEFTDKNASYFYSASDFSYLQKLQENYLEIRNELIALLERNISPYWMKTFPDYVESSKNQNWKVFTFLFFLMKSPKHAALCPKTSELIFSIPEIISCDFSLLPGNTKILPHKGYSKMILRVHLPLVVPKGNVCGLKVGSEIHYWEEGELVIFDDSFTHEAWNESVDNRIVLMFDIPNPKWGYSAEEIAKYKIENIDDPFLLSHATKNDWLKAFTNRVLPVEEF